MPSPGIEQDTFEVLIGTVAWTGHAREPVLETDAP